MGMPLHRTATPSVEKKMEPSIPSAARVAVSRFSGNQKTPFARTTCLYIGRGLDLAGSRGIECLSRYIKTGGWGFGAEYYSTATLSSSGRDILTR